MHYYQIALCGQNLGLLTYASAEALEPGRLVSASLRGRPLRGVVLAECAQPAFKTLACQPLDEALSPLQMQLLRFIAQYYVCEIGLAAAMFAPLQRQDPASETAATTAAQIPTPETAAATAAQIPAPSENPLFSQKPPAPETAATTAGESPAPARAAAALHFPAAAQPPKALSPAQNDALAGILRAPASLLFADTGAGKTEIYIHAIARALAAGRQVLFLMPEISLTPQMCERIGRHFAFGLWHSKITPAQKKSLLKALAAGQIRLVLGARSALFLPWQNLGLIVVDEEHDGSYKAAKNPCINARDLALVAAKFAGAQAILGSATPSLASANNPHLQTFRLKGSYFGGEREVEFLRTSELLPPELLEHIERTAASGAQSMVFLPLRANFRRVACKNCGSVKTCPRCSVAMSLHKSGYKCHYCGAREAFSPSCGACGSQMLEGQKMGTAQLASELEAALAARGCAAKIARLDSDSASTPGKLKKILKSLERGEINVLVGTQMMAKGHDYANVAFCAVLGLDAALNYPEFAARENTLALAIQVAGRAGRAGRAKVLLLTQNEGFFARYMNDYDAFLRDESAARGIFPPHSRLLRFVIESRCEREAAGICEQLAAHLQAVRKNESDYQILGYGPCALAKIDNLYRFSVLVRSEQKMLLSRLAAHYKSLPKVTIDIDPLVFS